MKRTPGRLTISRLTITNCLSVKRSTIDLGEMTVLKGRNESGKTTHIKALKSALGLERATLGRLTPFDATDDEEPSVEVIMVGDDMEVHVKREGTGSPEVKYRQGDTWHKPNRPVEWLNALVDVHAAVPAVWLAANDEERATMILEACKIRGYSRQDLLDSIGLPDFTVSIPEGLHPLEDIERVEAAITASRLVVGRNEKDETAAAGKLLQGLPAEPPYDVHARIGELEASTARCAEEIARELAAANAAYDATRVHIRAEGNSRADRIRTDHAAAAAEIRARAEREIGELLMVADAEVEALREALSQQVQVAISDREAEVARVDMRKAVLAAEREQLATARSQQQAANTDRHVRATAGEGLDKARQHAIRYAYLTSALSRLGVFRLQLAEQLPIKGLTVHFDEKGKKHLMHDGKLSEHWSDGETAKLAMEYAMLGSEAPEDGQPYVPIILLDRAGDLSQARRAALFREVAARGSQVIAAVTSECDFTVLLGEEALAGAA